MYPWLFAIWYKGSVVCFIAIRNASCPRSRTKPLLITIDLKYKRQRHFPKPLIWKYRCLLNTSEFTNAYLKLLCKRLYCAMSITLSTAFLL